MKCRCQYCGTPFPDENELVAHTATCFSRITTCSLCGISLPAQHRDEHLRVIHGLERRRPVSPQPSRAAAATAVNSNRRNHSRDPNNTSSSHQTNMEVMPIFGTGGGGGAFSHNPTARLASKSPTLTRVVAAASSRFSSGTGKGDDYFSGGDSELQEVSAQNFVGDDNNNNYQHRRRTHNNSPTATKPQQRVQLTKQQQQRLQLSSGGASAKKRTTFADDVDGNNNRPSTTPSTTPKIKPTSGFSFRSNDALLERARMPQHLRTEHDDDETSSNKRNPATREGGGGESGSAAAGGIMDMRTRQRMKIVEDVVHNILTHSPRRDYGNNLLSAAGAHTALGSNSASKAAWQSASSANQHSMTATMKIPNAQKFYNEEMSACPECGKVVLSMDRHHCSAQSTACPKCGETVALLSFDRHFIECAVPGWQFRRERKELEEFVARNEASFSASKSFRRKASSLGGSSSNTLLQRRQSQQSNKSIQSIFDEDDDDDENDDTTRKNRSGGDDKKRNMSNDLAFLGATSMKSEAGDSSRRSSVTACSSSSKQQQHQQQQQPKPAAAPNGHRACVLCGKFIPESQLAEHLDACDDNLLSCPLCQDGVPAHKLDEHQLTECSANRRRCFCCNTSVQFSRLVDHVARCCATGDRLTMYHGTTEKSARKIVQDGFLPSASGLLGEGVYMSADKGKAKNYGPVIIEAVVTFVPGRTVTIDGIGHRLQKTWQRTTGYDAAWMPAGVSKSGLEEHCIKNPKQIAIVTVHRD